MLITYVDIHKCHASLMIMVAYQSRAATIATRIHKSATRNKVERQL